jgi:hypothetical protein
MLYIKKFAKLGIQRILLTCIESYVFFMISCVVLGQTMMVLSMFSAVSKNSKLLTQFTVFGNSLKKTLETTILSPISSTDVVGRFLDPD